MLYGNLWIAISSIASPYIVIGTGAAGTVQPAMIRREQIRKLVGIGSLVVSLMISLAGSSEWMRWLQFRNGVPFGVNDPILGHDIGFYVFRLPLFDLVQQIGVAVVVVSLIGSAAAYVLAGALNFTKRGGVSVVRKARLHLSLLVAAFFLLLAASAYLGSAAPADRCDGTRHRARRLLHRCHGADARRARADGCGVAVGARSRRITRFLPRCGRCRSPSACMS